MEQLAETVNEDSPPTEQSLAPGSTVPLVSVETMTPDFSVSVSEIDCLARALTKCGTTRIDTDVSSSEELKTVSCVFKTTEHRTLHVSPPAHMLSY